MNVQSGAWIKGGWMEHLSVLMFPSVAFLELNSYNIHQEEAEVVIWQYSEI